MATSPNLESQQIQIKQPGPATVMALVTGMLNKPMPHDVIVRHEAIGVNYHDIYVRSGAYQTMSFPGIPGIEASGVIEWIGDAVVDLKPGDRVSYITASYGTYSSRSVIPASQLISLPTNISHRIAAAMLLKGITADMLLRRVTATKNGDTIVVHAAAGGVGQIIVQLAKALNVKVIGVVGNEEKAELAKKLGCDHVVVRGKEPLAERIMMLSKGIGVDSVFDGVGAQTFDTSIECLRPFGKLCLFGQASGPVPPIEPALLATKSLTISRPIVFHHIADQAALHESAGRLFAAFQAEELKMPQPQCFALKEAAKAHQTLELGQSVGSLVLLPDNL